MLLQLWRPKIEVYFMICKAFSLYQIEYRLTGGKYRSEFIDSVKRIWFLPEKITLPENPARRGQFTKVWLICDENGLDIGTDDDWNIPALEGGWRSPTPESSDTRQLVTRSVGYCLVKENRRNHNTTIQLQDGHIYGLQVLREWYLVSGQGCELSEIISGIVFGWRSN